MADDSPFHDPTPRATSKDAVSKTFLGGTTLKTRTALFFIIGILCLAGAGGVMYQADRMADAALARTAASEQVRGLVSRIEAGALRLNADARNFLLEKDLRHAQNYEKRTQPILADLDRLAGLEAAKTVANHISTVNDGINQLAGQFDRIVGVQRIVGLKDGDGLVNLVRDTAAGVEDRLVALNAVGLIRDFSNIRSLEARLVSTQEPQNAEQISRMLDALKSKVTTAILPQTDVGTVRSLLEAYDQDFTQLVSANETLANEVKHLDEINAYMAPSLDALIAFAGDIVKEAQRAQAQTRDTVRMMLGGGTGGIVVVLMLLGILLISSVTRPTARLARAATRLAHGEREVAIPALGNYDETGEIANALTYFRENVAQADRLRKELESRLSKAAARSEKDEEQLTAEVPTVPVPVERPNIESQITEISRLVTQTSANASVAAKDAERTDAVISGLEKVRNLIADLDHLMGDVRDQAGLLAVHSAIRYRRPDSPDTAQDGEDETLIVLPSKGRGTDRIGTEPLMTPQERIEDIQSRSRRAVTLVREIAETLSQVNTVATDLAAETSSHALQTTTQLLHQSEDLRRILDGLLERVRPGAVPGPRARENE